MSYKKLAYIGRIVDIQPIKKADFIVSATVVCGEGGKWMGTVKKDQFEIGDLCEVYLQDALLPKTEEFAFMELHKYRVSMRKFKKVPSECLIMPLSLDIDPIIGDSIADIKGVTKYEKPISAKLAGMALGSFPTSIIPKTDEPNFQTVREMVKSLQNDRYYATVKADGSSGTIYRYGAHFGCCSRNLELKDEHEPAVWKLARKYNLEEKLPDEYAIQFEMVGPGIQKNRLGLTEIDMQVFNVWNIFERKYIDAEEMFKFCKALNLPTVEVIDWGKVFDFRDDDELRKYAEGKYSLSGKQREGIVIRPMIERKVEHERLSFKVINLNYKD